ncbi:hypothetical protein QYM36_001746 [Artemia franciscana]|uniref:ENTH domain-containing protein n=1 Tax=Artemia franciscana TaxID=6661 RepID=A0AA88IK38_ARTSF|nr:hypothetical protein QYM36_001746 [Artemia franciscana]
MTKPRGRLEKFKFTIARNEKSGLSNVTKPIETIRYNNNYGSHGNDISRRDDSCHKGICVFGKSLKRVTFFSNKEEILVQRVTGKVICPHTGFNNVKDLERLVELTFDSKSSIKVMKAIRKRIIDYTNWYRLHQTASLLYYLLEHGGPRVFEISDTWRDKIDHLQKIVPSSRNDDVVRVLKAVGVVKQTALTDLRENILTKLDLWKFKSRNAQA